MFIVCPEGEGSSTDKFRRFRDHKVLVVSQGVESDKVQVQIDPAKLVEHQVPEDIRLVCRDHLTEDIRGAEERFCKETELHSD